MIALKKPIHFHPAKDKKIIRHLDSKLYISPLEKDEIPRQLEILEDMRNGNYVTFEEAFSFNS